MNTVSHQKIVLGNVTAKGKIQRQTECVPIVWRRTYQFMETLKNAQGDTNITGLIKMTIDELRETKKQLEQAMNYCPPDGATIRVFEIAENAGLLAQCRYDDLAPVFCLLNAFDDLACRVDDAWDTIEAMGNTINELMSRDSD